MFRDEMTVQFQTAALFVILRVLRRKKWLEPADLTELRIALEHNRVPENLRNKLTRLLDETVLERETKKDTPRKQD